jgi:hypothetical protein
MVPLLYDKNAKEPTKTDVPPCQEVCGSRIVETFRDGQHDLGTAQITYLVDVPGAPSRLAPLLTIEGAGK